ncbi:hypothetical protein [Streptomyces sp. NPDC046862]|uniref:hypothetical protein n=1 Tax=Streptomyces sp. NPDC046862 TaxID=3154603 RepID=UPI003456FE8B
MTARIVGRRLWSTRGLREADRRPTGRLRRAVRPWLVAGTLAAVLTGCGIRSTQVPTDFGPAPSRVPCTSAGSDIAPQTSPGIPVQVFLLCSKQLVAVGRSVNLPDGTPDAQRRVLVAQGLLDELSEQPSAAEDQAGYDTDVQTGLRVSGPRPGDPEDALRLSTVPEQLTAYALAQIVCTFADSAAAEGDGSVVLGGPPGTEPLRRYECTTEVRSNPGAEKPPSSQAGTS